jgi:hypothetical protein
MSLFAFPFVTMHFCVFVLVPSVEDIEAAVDVALSPFDEALEVEPYRVHFDHGDVIALAKHFHIDPANLHRLAKKMPEWTNREGGVDRDGLFEINTWNPEGQWDWFEIGGRWDQYIPHSKNNTINAGTLARSNYLSQCLPNYLLTPDKEWLEHERFYLNPDRKGSQRVALKDGDWFQLVRDTLQRWPDYTVVCVDIHS